LVEVSVAIIVFVVGVGVGVVVGELYEVELDELDELEELAAVTWKTTLALSEELFSAIRGVVCYLKVVCASRYRGNCKGSIEVT